jgi:FtsP/CotA-like multicopper oxidase with cupredoxin domain/cold shock CspA family protein
VILNQPINYDYDRRSVTVLNVLEHALFLGPAERADVIIDFSKFAGKTLILYNDSPAPVPASDPRNDYYTGNADQTENGGAPSTSPGFGPNTRTIMQIRVAAGLDSSAPPDDYNPATLAALQTSLPAAYAATQGRPVVAESAYNPAFGTAWIDTYAHIFTGSAREPMFNFTNGTGVSVSMVPKSKAIQELFDPYGRMNATLGVELPFTSALNQTTIPLGFIDPTTDTLIAGRPQIWKITHNGVDTHAIHFHLVNVQVINRVGWDGMIKPPDPNELGWKDTVRMNPLEDIYVAMRGNFPTNLPFAVPSSVRTLDVTSPVGSTAGFTGVDPLTGVPMPVTNKLTNFGWEYTWHCHLLGHEENDMMRVLVLRKPASVDFDEDGISDVALYNTSTGVWSIKSSVGSLYNVTYGGAAYEPVPGDYDGDGKNDVVVYHSASGLWFIQPSTGSASYSVGYGGPAYTPVPGDYDGDGRTDIAVYHSASGLWFIKPSSGAADYFVAYGSAAYTPVPGDYDGDGKTDIAVYHPASGLWFIKPSSGAADYSVAYGSPAYTPIPGDYDGDGKTDVAVYHSASGLWFIKPSSGAADYYVGYGSPAYFPVPGDYDGDGKTDISVYHPASGLWFVRSSSGLPDYYVSYGGAGDIPVNLNYLLRYVY